MCGSYICAYFEENREATVLKAKLVVYKWSADVMKPTNIELSDLLLIN